MVGNDSNDTGNVPIYVEESKTENLIKVRALKSEYIKETIQTIPKAY